MGKLNEAAERTIREICGRYKDEKTPLMLILSDIQNEYGYIPLEVQEVVSEETGISVAEIYGVVTFYSFFTMTPKGRHPISVCLGTACYVRGSEKLLEEIKRVLGIDVGETTPDGKFSLDCLRCVGACGLAPVMMIGEKVYGRMEPQDIRKVLEEFAD